MTDTTTRAPLCFVDTETDGVHPDRKAWEIALIRRDYEPGGSTAYAETSINFFVDVDLATADPFGLKVGGFYDRHPVGRWLASTPEHEEGNNAGTTPPRVLPGGIDGTAAPGGAANVVARMTHGAHLVGVVPNFDAEVLANLLRDNALTPAWHYHLIDVEAMAVGWLNGRDSERDVPVAALQPPWRSDDLSTACGVQPPTEADRHTALGDALWAKRWYDAMTGATR